MNTFSRSSMPPRAGLITLAIAVLLNPSSPLDAAIIASSDFSGSSTSIPAVAWTPLAVERSASVPSGGTTTSSITASGTIDVTTNQVMIGTYVNQTQADSSSVGAYRWQYLAGATAPTGGAGTPLTSSGGAPYFHIAYAASADGSSGFTQTPSPTTTYVGSYVDNNVGDSGSPATYTWRLLSSITSTNGIPGVSTVNAQTYYLHIKYSQTGGATFTASSGESASIYPAAPGLATSAMYMNVDFSGVSSGATTWSGALKTPILTVSNTEAALEKLNVSFDLKANRLCPVVVRITSFDGNNNPTGTREGVVRPVVVNTFYRYSLDLHTLTPGSPDFQSLATKVQFSFILAGNTTDSFSWPKGAGNQYNQVTVDNLSFTRPSFYVAPNGLDANTGLTEGSPKRLSEVIKIAQPGDVICLNGGTYESTGNVLTVAAVSGTPSRWITIRPTSYSSPAVLRSTGWNTIEIYANCAYIDIHGLVIKGYYDGDNGPDAISQSLTLAGALADAAKLNTYPGQETNPAYTVFSDHQPYTPNIRDAYGNLVSAEVFSGVPKNTAGVTVKYNTNGISMSGRKKSAGGSDPTVSVPAAPYELVHHIRIAENIVYNNPAGGISTVGQADYIYIEGNTIFDNNKLTRYGSSGISFLDSHDFDGSTGHKMFVLNNTSGNNGINVRWGPRISTDATGRKTITCNFSDGNGIIIDSNNNNKYLGRTLVQNNVVFDNGGSGIHALRSDNVDIVSNTAFRNGKPNIAPNTVADFQVRSNAAHTGTTPPYATYASIKPAWMNKSGGDSINYGEIFIQSSKNGTVRNNILWARDSNNINFDPGAGNNNSYDYNLFGRDDGTTGAGIYLTNAVGLVGNRIEGAATAGDIFVNSTNSALSTYLKLRTSAPASPAIDTGFTWYNYSPREDRSGVARPQGTGTDIGAFEAVPFANLLENAGFENGADPAPWSISAGKGQVGGVQVRTGSYSARLNNGVTGGGVYRRVNGLSPNTTYQLKAWARLDQLGGGFNLYASNYGGAQINTAISSVGAWAEYNVTFTTGATNTFVDIGVWRNWDGYGSFDDFSLSTF